MPPQITRLVLLTIAIVVGYSAARWILTPPSFGQYGHYRGNALPEIAARATSYAGQASCDPCHAPQREKFAKSPHQPIACEACHGPCREHNENPKVVKALKQDDRLCLRCHESNPSRPAWHKQIVVKNHYTGQGACKECHLPHQPNDTP